MANEKTELGCRYVNGLYPKLKTTRLPRGLKFTNGRLVVSEKDMEELQNNEDFVRLYANGRGEIFLVTVASAPKINAPKVVTGSSTATGEIGASEQAARKIVTGPTVVE